MLYFIFTVNGNWKEYSKVDLSEDKRSPVREIMLSMFSREIELLKKTLKGKFLHFVHTSEIARTFFLSADFIHLWKDIICCGGAIGLLCHEDKPGKEYYFNDTYRMMFVISKQANILRDNGIEVQAYRGGYHTFSSDLILILDKNRIRYDFSCAPDYHMELNGKIVSEWRGASRSIYRMHQDDYRKEGSSNVYEIPVGMNEKKYLDLEKSSIEDIEFIAEGLKTLSEKENKDIIVSVVSNSFQYEKNDKINMIKKKIERLEMFGEFISLEDINKYAP